MKRQHAGSLQTFQWLQQIGCDWWSQSVLVPLGCSQLITVCRHTHNRHCRLWCVHPIVTGYSRGFMWVCWCVCVSAFHQNTCMLWNLHPRTSLRNVLVCVCGGSVCLKITEYISKLGVSTKHNHVCPSLCSGIFFSALKSASPCRRSQQQKSACTKSDKVFRENINVCVCGWPRKNSAGMLSLVIWQRTTCIIIPQLS